MGMKMGGKAIDAPTSASLTENREWWCYMLRQTTYWNYNVVDYTATSKSDWRAENKLEILK